MGFSDHLEAVDLAVGEHLCSPGVLKRGGVVIADPVSVMVERPLSASDMFDGRGITTQKPVVRTPFAEVASLRVADEFEAEGRRWRVVGAPRRPDDGRWWVADVDDLGPL